jgi:hypothetical protein
MPQAVVGGPMTEIKPEPEPGWSPSLWPKRMTLERMCLDARLATWKQLIGLLGLCIVMICAGVFFLFNSLYGHIYAYRGLTWFLGILAPPLFSFIAL